MDGWRWTWVDEEGWMKMVDMGGWRWTWMDGRKKDDGNGGDGGGGWMKMDMDGWRKDG